MTRIAVLADVHGNLPALDAVLGEIAREGFDRVVSAGDLVSGPMPVECLERLRGLALPVDWVRGNADRLAAALPADDPHPMDVFAHGRLSPEQRAFCAAWPLTVRLGDVLVCHGTPESDEGIVTAVTPAARLAAVLEGVDAGLVVGGHVHHQFATEGWVNAGSVGMPYEGRPGAFWLELAGGEPVMRRTDYDVEAALAAIEATGYPLLGELAPILRGEVTAAEAAEALEARAA